MKIVWLKPRSGYVTDLRSATLWGTICWGIRYLFGNDELVEFIKRCEDDRPDFVISSAFPFKQQGRERTPFFPNPLRFAPELDLDEEDVKTALAKSRLRKKYSKVQFLSQPDFERVLAGDFFFDEKETAALLNEVPDSRHLIEKDLLGHDRQFAWLLLEHYRKKEHGDRNRGQRRREEYSPHPNFIARSAPVRHEHSMTHNTIDRWRGGTLNLPDDPDDPNSKPNGQLFHAGDIWWSDPHDESADGEPKTGLFFLVHENLEGSVEKTLAPVLRFLEHWGIGADRTAGKGFFEFDIQKEDFKLAEPPDANAQLSLSLLIPQDGDPLLDEIKNKGGFFPYELESRDGKGWTEAGGFEKGPQAFFAEGSVFPGSAGRWRGRIRESLPVKPLGHKVFDNGLGLMVSLKWDIDR